MGDRMSQVSIRPSGGWYCAAIIPGNIFPLASISTRRARSQALSTISSLNSPEALNAS